MPAGHVEQGEILLLVAICVDEGEVLFLDVVHFETCVDC